MTTDKTTDTMIDSATDTMTDKTPTKAFAVADEMADTAAAATMADPVSDVFTYTSTDLETVTDTTNDSAEQVSEVFTDTETETWRDTTTDPLFDLFTDTESDTDSDSTYPLSDVYTDSSTDTESETETDTKATRTADTVKDSSDPLSDLIIDTSSDTDTDTETDLLTDPVTHEKEEDTDAMTVGKPRADDLIDFFTPLMTKTVAEMLTNTVTDTPVTDAMTLPMTDKEADEMTSPLIDLYTETVTDDAPDPPSEDVTYTMTNVTHDTMTDLLTDSLSAWMASTFAVNLDLDLDCFLCMYSPLKCRGSCSYSNWAVTDAHWVQMRIKELKYLHDKCYTLRDPEALKQQRAEVLDWMFEVSSFYFFHRQTAYLAQDFFDRYMMVQENIETSSMQLVAITSLFVAAKKEEVNPPKINAFAYVTGGACEVWEIHCTEVKMLKALKWRLCPETPISWLNIYAQIETEQTEEKFIEPFFTQEIYIQITELLDLCILDINSLDYSYGTLAAAAIGHFSSYELVHRISGISWKSLSDCYWWMNPFKEALMYNPKPQLRSFNKVKPENSHDIQTHGAKLDLLRRAQGASLSASCISMTPFGASGLLTPPSSAEKLLAEAIELDLLATLSGDD